MFIHIVHQNENIHLIADRYRVSVNDIMAINRHITDFNHLTVGMKIKIPLLNDEVLDILEETEPFVEDYYQKNEIEESKDDLKNEDFNEKNEQTIDDNEEIEREDEKKVDNSYIKFPYYYYKNKWGR